ncbi:MAG TPA: hypothetical protein VK913_02690, partial [Erythrobacter sp.]|nr:hypothetical protein [Erythrobacter sp.]
MSRPTGTPSDRTTYAIAATGAATGAGIQPTWLLPGLGAALLLSAAVLYFATGSWLVALAFVLGTGVLLGGVVVLDRMRNEPFAE